jgi:NAD(P)-dependent dehydrogenase (short-subunit alcohol dehydrogenase family)
VVGTGASAIQLVPAIVDRVSALTVFQRTPAWIFPRDDRQIPRWRQRLYARWPVSQRIVREGQYWRRELVVHAMVSRLVLLERAAEQARRRLATEVPDRDLRSRLEPDYLPGCKRALLSDDFYRTVGRDRVQVVGALERVAGRQAVTVDGDRHELDVLVLATGFEVLPPPMANRVFGLDGVSVAADWVDRGGAFLGMATAAAPNLFWLTGPNTGLGGNSMIVMIEAQARYLAQAAAAALAGDPENPRVLAVSPVVQRRYTNWIEQRMAGTVWQLGGCNSWYLDERPSGGHLARADVALPADDPDLPISPLRTEDPMHRSVIITGAGSGIGTALAARLAARGDRLTLADINGESVARVAAELAPVAAANGGSVCAEVVDVRAAAQVQALVDGVVASAGGVDIMVNNAGIGLGGPAQEMPLSHWQRVLDVNLSGVMHGVVAVYPHMVAAGRGRIVNIASLAGLVPAPYLVAYSAAKHGVVGLSLSLAAEAAGTGVEVTCVCPGFTDTPILDSQPPADLPPMVLPASGRELAEAMPGELYPVADLARDIESAIDRGEMLL